MIEGFAKDVSLNDVPNYINEERQAKRKRIKLIALVSAVVITLAGGIGVALYFTVFQKKPDKPSPIP